MKEPHVDADKICKHIKYTQHWLDKANDDFQEKRFASGGIVLNLARAELTAAWEELIQLKTQVTRNLPRKARTHWKPLSSVGLLASGFFIAMFFTHMAGAPVPGLRETSNPPSTIRATDTASDRESAQKYIESLPETVPVTGETSAISSGIKTSAEPAKTIQPRKTVRKPAAKPAPVETVNTISKAEHAPAVAVIEKPATLPYTPVGHSVPESSPQNKSAAKPLENAEIIDLFNTAQKTLRK